MPGLKINLNPRQRNIIHALLQSDGRLTIDQLAKHCGLTARVIRYNLNTVRAWLRNEGVPVRVRPGFGIEIEANRAQRKRLMALFEQSQEENLVLSRSQRQHLILFELLVASAPLTYQQLAEMGSVSRSTIVNDIDDVEQWLNLFSIQLIRLPKRGVFIQGSEAARRFALLNLIREELGDRKWYLLWKQLPEETGGDKSIPPRLEKFLRNLPLKTAHVEVVRIENMIGRSMSLYSKVETLVYLAISIVYLQEGRSIPAEQSITIEKNLYYEVAAAVFGDLRTRHHFSASPAEVGLLAACLCGAKWDAPSLDLSGQTKRSDLEALYPAGAACAKNIISTCARQLHPLLLLDEELFAELTRHLEPVLYRIRYHLPILNENLPQIQQLFPEIFLTAQQSLQELEKVLTLSFPPEETAYVAMYLLSALNRLNIKDRNKTAVVLVGDGIRAKVSLLRSRLEREFPNLKVIGIVNGFSTESEVLQQANLILSTDPIELPNFPLLNVSPFLHPAEKKMIQNWLVEQESEVQRFVFGDTEKPELIDLLHPDHIVISNEAMDWRMAVQKASQPLLTNGHILPEYVRAMNAIIEQHGAYMWLAPQVLILHARPVDGVLRLCLSVMILKNPVAFGEEPEHWAQICLVLGAVDDHAHLKALLKLNHLLNLSDFREKLIKAQNSAEVIRTFWTFMMNLTGEEESAIPN